jgi:hypothetical protein
MERQSCKENPMRKRAGWFVIVAAGLLLVMMLGATYVAGSQENRFKVDMTGAQEVPPADPDGSAKADLTIDAVNGVVCFDIKLDAVGTPNRGHIHFAPPGTNGGIVVPFFELAATPGDARNDALEKGRLEDCVSGDPAVLAAIIASPHLYYVNVHNSRFPGGAVRGQLTLP